MNISNLNDTLCHSLNVLSVFMLFRSTPKSNDLECFFLCSRLIFFYSNTSKHHLPTESKFFGVSLVVGGARFNGNLKSKKIGGIIKKSNTIICSLNQYIFYFTVNQWIFVRPCQKSLGEITANDLLCVILLRLYKSYVM